MNDSAFVKDPDAWAETRASAIHVEIEAWRYQEQRLRQAQLSEVALCRALREHLDLEEVVRRRAQEEAVSERRSEAAMAQRARQVRGAVASAKEATEKLVRVMTSLRQAGSAAPKLHEEVKQLELEERQAAISKWWTQKRWQEVTHDVQVLEGHRQSIWKEEKEMQLREEEYSEQLTTCEEEHMKLHLRSQELHGELDEEHRRCRHEERNRIHMEEQMQEKMLRQKSLAFRSVLSTESKRCLVILFTSKLARGTVIQFVRSEKISRVDEVHVGQFLAPTVSK